LAQAFASGVSPDSRDDKSYTLLMQSAMNGNMRCMKVRGKPPLFVSRAG
jgi:ankyrin repeat protein